jgi:transcriptional regulator with XRE-family HTH domain
MYPSISDQRGTVGQVLARLMEQYKPSKPELYKALKTSNSTYLKIERDQRDLSLVMALRVCRFYQLDLHKFISMLSEEELSRQDFSVSKALEKRERKKAEAALAKVIDITVGSGK